MTKLTQIFHFPIWQILVVSCLLVLILGRFWVVGTSKVLFNTLSSDGDESAYLTLGLDLREKGILTDGTRPPLYPLLLATVAQRDWAYFTSAKFLSLTTGLLAIIAAFLAGRRLFSLPVALFAAFLLGVNNEFHLRASTIYADTLLVTIFLGAWYFSIKSLEGKRYLFWTGLFAGLAFLTKGSAPLLLGAWGVLVLYAYRVRVLKQPALLLVPLVFLIVSSPLLLYNYRQFESPVYNFATTHVMWMDRWAESQVASPEDLPTLATYIETHTWADVYGRLQRGMERLHPTLGRTLIPTRTWQPNWLGWGLLAYGLVMLLYVILFQRSALWAYVQARQYIWVYSIALFAAFYGFSVWYAQVMMESRFLIPVLGPIYILVADVFITPLRSLRQMEFRALPADTAKWAYATIMTCLFVFGVGWLMQSAEDEMWSLTVDPFVSDQEANQETDAVLAWLVEEKPEGDVQVTFGPSKSLPLWKFPRRVDFNRVPVSLNTWSDLDAYLTRTQADFVILDSDTARRRRSILSPYFAYTDDFARIESIPAGWSMNHLHGTEVCRWCIFDPDPIPSRVVSANLEDKVHLFGYDAQVKANTNLINVNLYWEALTELNEDYTIFVHVTALDGFVKAQQDRQPFNALWPTSYWQTSQKFVTDFDIAFDPNMETGEYLLITGMYELETGERLPLLDGPTIAPSPNGILLGQISVQGS